MSNSKDTDIHSPDGIFFKGEKKGHGGEESKIRKRDGVIFKGEELGYIDKEGKIRKPDGFIFKGEKVGQIKKDSAAHAEDGFFFKGEQWGYVDDEGNVRQKDGFIFRGRIIGKMRGRNKAATLGFFVLQFKRLEENFEKLEGEVRSAKNKVSLLGKVRHMLEYVPKADALGDFDGLMGKLRSLENEIVREKEKSQSRKEELCRQVDTLSYSSDWKTTTEKLKQLQEEWKSSGSAGKEENDRLWEKFRASQDRFFERKKQHFEKIDSERRKSRERKESLCLRAESLSHSSDWKTTGEALKNLMEDWKKAGSAGKDYDDNLWSRFRHAQDKFYERRKSHYEKIENEQRENLRRKERLCSEAESLVHSSDFKHAKEEIRQLQEKWKTIGHVPRDYSDDLWNRFRRACDRVFENARREYERKQEEYERKQSEWRSKMREALERKRERVSRLKESIRHDESNISRWRDTIYNLKPGGRADEIESNLESRINDVEDRIRDKERTVDELEDSIRDIESKLY